LPESGARVKVSEVVEKAVELFERHRGLELTDEQIAEIASYVGKGATFTNFEDATEFCDSQGTGHYTFGFWIGAVFRMTQTFNVPRQAAEREREKRGPGPLSEGARHYKGDSRLLILDTLLLLGGNSSNGYAAIWRNHFKRAIDQGAIPDEKARTFFRAHHNAFKVGVERKMRSKAAWDAVKDV
jgi:hypothetical protein